MAVPRRQSQPAEEARLHDHRVESWLTVEEIDFIRRAFREPMTRELWAVMNARAGAACYYLALVDPDFDPVLIDEYAERAVGAAAEDRRRHAAEAWAKAAGLRWRDVHERFGFAW